MSRPERWYRVAMRAYPRSYRHEHEDEIIATLLDLDTAERRDMLVEFVSLVWNGLGQRARQLPDAAAGFRLAGATAASAVIVAAVTTITYRALLYGTKPDSVPGVFLGAIVALATISATFTVGPVRPAHLVPIIAVGVSAALAGTSIGFIRPLLLALTAMGIVATVCPPVRRSTAGSAPQWPASSALPSLCGRPRGSK